MKRKHSEISQLSKTQIFVEKARLIHGDEYDYSVVDYKKSLINVVIICRVHGNFLQKPKGHLRGRGCQKCSVIKQANKRRKSTQTDFIEQSIAVHGAKYDYSLAVYTGQHKKVQIICRKHNHTFEQVAHLHLNGHEGCRFCFCEGRSSNTIDFIQKAQMKYGLARYDYSNVDYKRGHLKVKIRCIKHNVIFEQIPPNHLRGRQGCPKCSNNRSIGEENIQKYLSEHFPNYSIQREYYIKCQDADNSFQLRKLRADFYLEGDNVNTRMLIEFDGMHHFKPTPFYDENQLFHVIRRDRSKNLWCKKKNIHLCRISFLEIKSIPEHLQLFFDKIKNRKPDEHIIHISNPELYNKQREVTE